MSTKLRAEYTELVNNYLDNIPAKKEEDFEVIKIALRTIIDPSLVQSELPDDLAGRVNEIKNLINEPELYVHDSNNFSAFKEIITSRVAAKIQEIEKLGPLERKKYIENQSSLRARAEENQEVMANSEAPDVDSEAHTISHAQWLQEIQAQFRDETLPLTGSLGTFSGFTITTRLAELHRLNEAISARLRILNNESTPTIASLIQIQIMMSYARTLSEMLASDLNAPMVSLNFNF